MREGNVFLAGQVDFDGMLPALDRWFNEMHESIYSEPPSKPGRKSILMACPIWGDKFIQRFLDFCLPTMMAKQNRQALKGACRIILFTDRAGFKKLWGVARQLTAQGFPTQLKLIPPRIIKMAMDEKWPLNKYWLLGTCQQIGLQYAARYGMAWHALHPDHAYGQAYFENMARLAKQFQNIAQTSISGDVEKCVPELEAYRQADGSLQVPDRALGDIAFRHLHGQTKQTVFNHADLDGDLPDSHCMVWVGKDFVRLHVCHMNAAYLAPEVVAKAAVRLYNALDTELPNYMFGEFCVPEISDGMTFVELSDDSKIGFVRRVPFPMLALRCWQTTHFYKPFLTFFNLPNDVPIAEQADYLPVEEIERRHAAIKQGLEILREPIQAAYLETREEFDNAGGESGAEAGLAGVVRKRGRKARDLRQRAGDVAGLPARGRAGDSGTVCPAAGAEVG